MEIMMIKVETQFEATHKYPDAPEEVAHLRNEHRHTFMVFCEIEVEHENRALEFYLVKDYLDTVIKEKSMNNLSCEQICKIFREAVIKKYGKRRTIIEVSEDGRRAGKIYTL